MSKKELSELVELEVSRLREAREKHCPIPRTRKEDTLYQKWNGSSKRSYSLLPFPSR